MKWNITVDGTSFSECHEQRCRPSRVISVYVACEIGTVHQFRRAADTATSQIPRRIQPLSDAWVSHVITRAGWQGKWLRWPNVAYSPPRLERSWEYQLL